MTAAVDRLAMRGLVRRTDDAEDRRACIVQLTPAGRRMIEAAFAKHRATMEEAVAGFLPEDRRTFLPLLRRLGRAAEASAQMMKEAPVRSRLDARRRSK
jgi:MarR family 2-MHQ and catechol resistance regulon transcriptional repressor